MKPVTRLRRGHIWSIRVQWVVTMPTGALCYWSAARTKRAAVKQFLAIAIDRETWRQFYYDGFRLRRVMLSATLLP